MTSNLSHAAFLAEDDLPPITDTHMQQSSPSTCINQPSHLHSTSGLQAAQVKYILLQGEPG